MTLDNRIEAFAKLGEFLSQFHPTGLRINEELSINDPFLEVFQIQIKRAFENNGWFTRDNVYSSFFDWGILLNKNDLNSWSSTYTIDHNSDKTIGVIMAGNIPLVGFHDFLTVLMSGNSIVVKQSSSDAFFLPLIAKLLETVEPGFKGRISFSGEKLSGFDAVIATGSNNTARHFEYYFGSYPHIIRRNRNSVAVLSGDETENELEGLGEDIFRYFGLGCRSVSKLMVPRGYDFDKLFGALYSFKDLLNYEKYRNNYDYNKAVYLMSKFDLLENGFVMLKEDSSYASPIATLFYEYYDDEKGLKDKLKADEELIQCVVGKGKDPEQVPFGKTQKPQLHDYADGVDTFEFLVNL